MALFTKVPMPRLRLPRWCFLLLLALGALTACTPARVVTLAEQPEAVRWTRPLNESPVRQTLFLPAGANEIELLLALPADGPASPERPLYWALRDSTLSILQEGEIDTASLPSNSPLRIPIDPFPTGQQVEVALTGSAAAELALWTSEGDRYLNGTILDNELNNVDLHFTLRLREGLAELPEQLWAVAQRWRRLALWLPLLLVTPGWLLGWLLTPGSRRGIAPLATGLSLSLAPLVYLWADLIGLRLFEPLVKSLFQASGVLLLLLMVHDPSRLHGVWQRYGRWARGGLLLALFLGMVTWLLATRFLIAPPSSATLDSGILTQELVWEGKVEHVGSPLPFAALSATLTQLSRQPIASMLLFSGLILGVALIATLYALAEEVSEDPWLALWILPLAWLWPTPWEALALGQLERLYSLLLLPTAFTLGLRALREEAQPGRTLLIAAVPLAALGLLQGVGALLLLPLLFLWRRVEQRAETEYDPDAQATDLLRLSLWALVALLLLFPLLLSGSPLSPQVPLLTSYPLLVVALLLAYLFRQVGQRLTLPAQQGVALLALLALLPLLWWRSAPLLPQEGLQVTESEVNALQWPKQGTQGNALFLVNVQVEGERLLPLDAGAWLPLYGERPTILQRRLPPELLAAAMVPGALADPALRRALSAAGVTHLYVRADSAPLDAAALLGQEWTRLSFQMGESYIFELPPPPPDPDS